jgi:ABC-2 type transport system ATP-binding protein
MSQIAIRCQALTKHFGAVEALKSLDLEVPAGSVFGFLGRNGAGKTTAMRLLTGLAQPTSGTAWVAGHEMTEGDVAARTHFGYLPEEPSFYTWMTPKEYLDFIGRIFSLDQQERQQRTAELLTLTGLEKVANRRIGGFSKGMRQRLGLAQALVHNPKVLFLDEPTSALDPAGRRDVLELINRLRGETTIFLSSHILADVERVCDTIGVIHEGELILVAGRDALLSDHGANVILIELDRHSLDQAATFLERLAAMPWVQNASQDYESIRVTVTDANKANQAIVSLLVDEGLVMTRYEWVRPSLEEVFLSISR